MARYHGKSGRVYMSTSGSGDATPVVSLSGWTLDLSTERADTTCFEDGNKTSVMGFPAYKGTISGFWDNTEDVLATAQSSTTAVKMYIYPSLNAVSKYYYGTAWVDLSLDGSVSDAIKISGNFEAAGSWANK